MTYLDYKLFTATSAQELIDHQDETFARFVALSGELDPGLTVGGSTWTVRDVVGHVLTVLRRYTRRDPTTTEGLADTPREVDRLNDEELAVLGSSDRDELLASLVEEMGLVRERFSPETMDLHAGFPFHGGVVVDGAAGASNLIGEFLIHGRDLALAAGRPWAIDRRDSVLILNGVMQILPAYVRRDCDQPLRLLLRVPGAEPWVLDFTGGSSESRLARERERVDAIVRVPATTLALALYSRLSPMAATRAGMLVVGGRRPWRIVRLPRLLEQP